MRPALGVGRPDRPDRTERVDRADRTDRVLSAVAFVVPFCVVATMHSWTGASYVGSTMLAVLLAKLVIARRELARRRPETPAAAPHLRVCAVVPLHNEDPALAVAAVRSLVEQTRPPSRIHVVDDGSSDGAAAARAVVLYLREVDRTRGRIAWEVTRCEDNRGKRHALATAFRSAGDTDVFLCVDSDTRLDPDAIEHGLRPFADPEVAGVAGLVMAMNWRRNVLTRLIDLRYVSAFLSERAAYSYFGSVLCCCGSLSFYRSEVVLANLDDFLGQRFLGQAATFGDDRRLTNYALRAGRVVLAERSRAETAVPERLSHYLRQQVRWNKSFIRESTWVLGTFPVGHPAFWLTLCEAVAWLVVGGLMFIGTASVPLLFGVRGLLALVLLTAAAAYARTATYLEGQRRDVGRLDRLAVFAIAPLYGALHVLFLLPVRAWALLTLRRTAWGTRTSVEVRL